MACAYTKHGDDVWVTFLKRRHAVPPQTPARMYLHTAPKLNHAAANLTLADIDYATTSPQLGKYVTKENFTDIALAVWSYFGDDLELKTKDELECRVRQKGGCGRQPSVASISLLDEDEDFSGSCAGEDSGHAPVVNTDASTDPMTLDEAIRIQAERFNGGKVDRDRVKSSFDKYGHITPDKFIDLSDDTTDEEDTNSECSIILTSSSKRRRGSDTASTQLNNKGPKLYDDTGMFDNDVISITSSCSDSRGSASPDHGQEGAKTWVEEQTPEEEEKQDEGDDEDEDDDDDPWATLDTWLARCRD